MQTVTIERRVCLEPRYLDSNIHLHLLTKLEDSVRNECTHENGYILRVHKIVDIPSHSIANANLDIVFTLRFTADILRPQVGMVLESKVLKVYPQSIFVIAENRQRMVIPADTLGKQYKYKSDDGVYASKKRTIRAKDTVRVEITDLMYEKHTFMCICKLYEE